MKLNTLTLGTLMLGCVAVLLSGPITGGAGARAQGRDAPAPGTRIALNDGLPAIDRGLHAERLGFTSRFDVAPADDRNPLPVRAGPGHRQSTERG